MNLDITKQYLDSVLITELQKLSTMLSLMKAVRWVFGWIGLKYKKFGIEMIKIISLGNFFMF